jgi:uncharacterized membrane protein
MDIKTIYKESFEVVRKNFILIVPTISVAFILTILALILIGINIPKMHEAGDAEAMTGIRVGAFIIGILGFFLQAFSHGMTIAMASDVHNKKPVSLKRSFNTAMSKIEALTIAGLLVGLLFSIGMMLLFIPGLAVAYLFMFTFVIIITEDAGATEAMKKSFVFVKANLSQTFILFASLGVTAIVITFINSLFSYLPFLGQLLTMVLMGGYFAFLAVTLFKSFMVLKEE